jgi:hypothetical protein
MTPQTAFDQSAFLVVRAIAFAGAFHFVGPGLPLHAQEALSPRDSADVRVQALQVLLDTIGISKNANQRMWIRPMRQRTGATDTVIEHSPVLRSALETAFPGVRFVTDTTTLFLCPPGVVVRMPGQSCPIREDGIIVNFGRLTVRGDSLQASVWLINSGGSTAFHSMELLFSRGREQWYFHRSVSRTIS